MAAPGPFAREAVRTRGQARFQEEPAAKPAVAEGHENRRAAKTDASRVMVSDRSERRGNEPQLDAIGIHESVGA